MATLSKRANSLQRKLLRIVEGAVKNAADAHPHWNLEPQMARSISKRAVGTLSSQLDEIGLAAAKPPLSASNGGGSNRPIIAQSPDSNMATDAARLGQRQTATANLVQAARKKGTVSPFKAVPTFHLVEAVVHSSWCIEESRPDGAIRSLHRSAEDNRFHVEGGKMSFKRLYEGFTNPDKVYQDYQSRKEPTMAEPLVDQIWHQMTDIKARVESQQREAEKLKMHYERQKAQAMALYAQQAYAQQQANPDPSHYGIYGGGYAIPTAVPGVYTSITNYPNGIGQQVNQWPSQAQPWSPAPVQMPSPPTYPPGLATIWADMRIQAANGNWEKVLIYINWISQLTGNFGNGPMGAINGSKTTSHDPIFSLSELEQAQDLVDEIRAENVCP